MSWRAIRLELVSHGEHVDPSCALVLRAPLDEDGRIDYAAVERAPHVAIVRRFWKSEPDRHGFIRRAGRHWLLHWTGRSTRDMDRLRVTTRIRLHSHVAITRLNGLTLFQVAGLTHLQEPARRDVVRSGLTCYKGV